MPERTGREVVLEVLASEGVRHIFGNPGTTELPLLDELAAHPEFTYVLALQEGAAVAMADGYARASGRPAFVNLHTASGLGSGIGQLGGAVVTRSPLVVIAGQEDRRHLVADPALSADLTGLARPVSKWQYEVHRLDELATVLRRAFLDAARPPAGPVFVSIPSDVLDEAGEVAVPPRSHLRPFGAAVGLEELADLLAEAAPDELAIVAGAGIGAAGALTEAAALAEALGTPVFGAVWSWRLNFPTTHPCWAGMLPFDAASIREALSRFRRVFVVGAQALQVIWYSPGPPIPAGCELLHLDDEAALVGRHHPVRLGVVGDIRASLAALLPLVQRRVDRGRAAAAVEAARSRWETALAQAQALAADHELDVPMHPRSAVRALLRALPRGGVLVDESVMASIPLRQLYLSDDPGTYHSFNGTLGWGVPAAIGVKLARPDVPVLGVVGDGSAMYTIPALWTAAHHRVPVVVAVVNNRGYGILKQRLGGRGGPSAALGRFVGIDLADPALDFVGLAQAMGVDAEVVEKASDVTDAVRSALESGRPGLVELPVALLGPT